VALYDDAKIEGSERPSQQDGIIAVTIDDNEIFYCGQLMDEIFGSGNRLACAPWLAEPSGGKQKTSLRSGHEYVLIYHNMVIVPICLKK
jgi:adenine specific DNA methylase Mod